MGTQRHREKRSSGRPTGSPRKDTTVVHEISAGGLVFKRTPRGVYFAMMKDSYGKWTFPKGRREAGEEVEEAGARETMEELGLEQIRLLEPLGQITIWFRDRFERKGSLVHKDISYFLFVTPTESILSLQPDEHVQEVEWVPAKDVLSRSFYPDLIPVIQRALGYVRNHPKIV